MRDGSPSLESTGGMVSHHWSRWEEFCLIIGVNGRNGASMLQLVKGMVPVVAVGRRNGASLLESVGGMVLHR